MTLSHVCWTLAGGALFGLGVSALMWLHGRIAGFSGICGDLLSAGRGERQWRLVLLAGVLVAGLAGGVLHPEAFVYDVDRPSWVLVPAGLLVGFGTRYGCGCTSGHGIAGLARLSLRSFAATLTFMGVGAIVVAVVGGAR
jgi:uncharacterized protein